MKWNMITMLRGASPDETTRFLAPYVYSTLLVLSSLALVPYNTKPGAALILVIGTGVSTALAHLFADIAAFHVRETRPMTGLERRNAAAKLSPIVGAAVLPAVPMLLAALSIVPLRTATWTAFCLLLVRLAAVGPLIEASRPVEARSRRRAMRNGAIYLCAGVSIAVVKMLLSGH